MNTALTWRDECDDDIPFLRELYASTRQPVGRLYVERGQTTVLLIDVTVVPDHRGAGLGTALLRDLMDEAAQTTAR